MRLRTADLEVFSTPDETLFKESYCNICRTLLVIEEAELEEQRRAAKTMKVPATVVMLKAQSPIVLLYSGIKIQYLHPQISANVRDVCPAACSLATFRQRLFV